MGTKTLHCPRDHGRPLEPTVYQGNELDICPRCSGLWCEPDDWEREHLGEPLKAPDPRGERPSQLCPRCRVPMAPILVEGVADLVLDQCATCRGVWFDHTELDSAMAAEGLRQHRESISKPTTWGQWCFQLLAGLPVEFNVPPRTRPWVTLGIVASCVVVFGLQHLVDLMMFAANTEGPFTVLDAATLVSHQFLHQSVLHLVGNMYLLYVLGDNVEDVLGHRRFLLFYLFCGAVAAIPHMAINWGTASGSAGASGAIAAVAAAYFVLFRHAHLTFMLFVVQFKVRAPFWLGGWFALQLLGAFLDPTGEVTHIGWNSHVTGFVAGLALILPFRKELVAEHPLLRLLR